MPQILTIERLWNELRTSSPGSRQRRIDASHPHDLYADFEQPDRPGLVAVCRAKVAESPSLRALSIDQGIRADGRWSLRIVLNEPQLLPVFAALCRDIITFTRTGVDHERLGTAVLGRIERWRVLLERDGSGLSESTLRGLIGELLVLEHEVLPKWALRDGIAAWTGPSGSPQDFLLPTGTHLEVKTISRGADTVRINGLAQLDAGLDPLVLVIVRVEVTGAAAPGAVTVPRLVERLKSTLAGDADALVGFDVALSSVGWHEHPLHDDYAVRPIVFDAYLVGDQFPRMTRATVPAGVEEADYSVVLPNDCRTIWRGSE